MLNVKIKIGVLSSFETLSRICAIPGYGIPVYKVLLEPFQSFYSMVEIKQGVVSVLNVK